MHDEESEDWDLVSSSDHQPWNLVVGPWAPLFTSLSLSVVICQTGKNVSFLPSSIIVVLSIKYENVTMQN